jgi:hypothetical protein
MKLHNALSFHRPARSLALVAAAALAFTLPLHADTSQIYNVSGSLPSAIYNYDGTTVIPPSTLSGTITVDQTLNSVSGADLFLSGGIVGEYVASNASPDYFNSSLLDIFAIDSAATPSSPTPANAFPILELVLPGTLSGNTIPLITDANGPAYNPGALFFSNSNVGQGEGQNISLTSGELSLASVPEPSSLALLATGLGSLAARLRRRRS